MKKELEEKLGRRSEREKARLKGWERDRKKLKGRDVPERMKCMRGASLRGNLSANRVRVIELLFGRENPFVRTRFFPLACSLSRSHQSNHKVACEL